MNIIENNFKIALEFQQNNKIYEAEKIYKYILKQNKFHLFSLINLGSISNEIGNYEYAKELLLDAIKINDLIPETFINLCNVYQNLKQHNNAIDCYKKAIYLNPNISGIYNNLGNSLKSINKIILAIKNYQKAINLDKNFYIAFNNLGIAHRINGEYKKAIFCFAKSIKINPKYLEAHYNIMEIQEKLGEINDLKLSINYLVKNYKIHPIISIFKILILIRENNYTNAIKEIKNVDIENFKLSLEQKARFFELKKIIYEKNNLFNKAYQAAKNFNYIDKSAYSLNNISKDNYLDYINSNKPIKSEKFKFINNFQISFLIGFPRSGTTLLDSILRSSKNIFVIEEQPYIQKTKEYFHKKFNQNTLNKEDIQILRSFYFNQINLTNLNLNNKLIIDKYPLNTIEIDFINKIFPDAKIIFAIRHPNDVIISCYMSRFYPNSAMANFLDIKDTILLYDKVMHIWKNYSKITKLDYHYIKYENVIMNFESTIKKLLSFLDLEWETSYANFNQTAIKRKKINTPSYNQVIKPLYKDSLFKWENYKEINLKNTEIKKWLDFFNY